MLEQVVADMRVRQSGDGLNDAELLVGDGLAEGGAEVNGADGRLQDLKVPSTINITSSRKEGIKVDPVVLTSSSYNAQAGELQPCARHNSKEMSESSKHLGGVAGQHPIVGEAWRQVERNRRLKAWECDGGARWLHKSK